MGYNLHEYLGFWVLGISGSQREYARVGVAWPAWAWEGVARGARGGAGLLEEIKRDKLFNEFGNRASFDAPFWCWAYSWAIRRAGVDGFAGRHRGAAMKYPSPWHLVQAPRHGERT